MDASSGEITPLPSHFRRIAELMGTVFTFEIADALPEDELEDAVATAVGRLGELEDIFTTFRPESEISRIGRAELALADATEEVRDVLDICQDVYLLSDGAFDVHAAAAKGPATQHQFAELALEPSGLVKGWAVERAMELFEQRGIHNLCINAGGDVATRGRASENDPWRVGLQHPHEKDKIMAVLETRDLGVATSGLYERGEHIVTVDENSELVSVTIAGPDLGLADAYATTVFAMGYAGLEWITTLAGYDIYAVDANDQVHWSQGLDRYLVRYE